MSHIDASKIKKMTNNLVAYQVYERNEKMKKNKLKHFTYAFLAVVFLSAGTVSVDAMTDNAISNAIKDVLKVRVNDKDYNTKCQPGENGKMVCTLDESVLGDHSVEFEVDENDLYDIEYNPE